MDIHIIVRPGVGWEEATCHGCGKPTSKYTELHLRHAAKKIVLCDGCDSKQLGAPRVVPHATER